MGKEGALAVVGHDDGDGQQYLRQGQLTGIVTAAGAPFTSSTRYVSALPKFVPMMDRVAPLVGKLLGETLMRDGGAYARPLGTNEDDWPRTVTVTKEITPVATGRTQRSNVSGEINEQLDACKSPGGTRMDTWV
jgi:hypothetical protein